jgi:hypothetical protein
MSTQKRCTRWLDRIARARQCIEEPELNQRLAPDSLGDTTMKFKTWADLARSLDEDLPTRQTITITGLIAEARAADWDFTNWCYASGYDTSDPEARRMFECLLAYAKRHGRAGLN